MPEESKRSYGCQFGCGNPFDVILFQVVDGSTLMLCTPCHIKLAIELVDAMTGDVSPEVEATRQELNAMDQAPQTGSRARRGRHNAPVGTTSDDLIEAYDSAVTVDELDDSLNPA